jgi:glyoxylase-like metal-dependent hydrolase (beta-lactamase superfamily II)
MTKRIGWLAGSLSVLGLLGCASDPPPPAEPPPLSPAPLGEPAPPPVTPVAAVTTVAPLPAAPRLKLRVVTGSPEGFLANSALITGEKDAVLVDAQFTIADGKRVADAVKESGKNLTFVYVTHSHPDHYFGFVPIREAYPNAKLVALQTTVDEIKRTWEAKVKQWKPMYKEGITAKPFLPEPLPGTTLELEGEKLELAGNVQGDDAHNSYVWIPSLRAAVAGDIVYDQVFPWTAETTPSDRQKWIAALDALSARNPAVVVPGHQKPERGQSPENVKFTRDYLVAYDEVLAKSEKASDLQAKMKAKYPDVALDVILKLGAEASFKKLADPAKKASSTDPAKKAAGTDPSAKKPAK